MIDRSWSDSGNGQRARLGVSDAIAQPVACSVHVPLVDLDGTGSASQAAGYDRRGGTAAEGVDHHATLARARPDEEVRQALRHHGFVLARRAVVLVVGLGYADHVAGIGAALQVRL